MCSIVLFSFYYMIYFALKVKAQKPFSTDIMKNCLPPDNYYNTIYNTCPRCEKKVYNNICYSSPPKSIYGFDGLRSTSDSCTNNNDYFTELDEEGKYSGELNCRSSKISGSYSGPSYGTIRVRFSFYYLDNIRSRQPRLLTHDFDLKDFDLVEINYFNYTYESCLKGVYEKSCQYLINLCVLNMYSESIIYCRIIGEFENTFTSYG